MLASIINMDGDITIFLTDEEIEKLGSQSLEGQIFEFQDVRKIYQLEVLVDKQPFEQISYLGNIGYTVQKDKYCVLITPVYYQELLNKKWVGNRAGQTKIDIMTETFARAHTDFVRDLKRIKSHYKNREKIIKKMKEKRRDS